MFNDFSFRASCIYRIEMDHGDVTIHSSGYLTKREVWTMRLDMQKMGEFAPSVVRIYMATVGELDALVWSSDAKEVVA